MTSFSVVTIVTSGFGAFGINSLGSLLQHVVPWGVCYKCVPKKLIEHPKQGFSISLGKWLRGHLREWAENLLDSVRLEQEGYFRLEPIRQKWGEHLSGKQNWQHQLWSVLMFQAWLEKQKESD